MLVRADSVIRYQRSNIDQGTRRRHDLKFGNDANNHVMKMIETCLSRIMSMCLAWEVHGQKRFLEILNTVFV